MTSFPLSMNKITHSVFLTLLCCISLRVSADSVPELLSYQGRISTGGGLVGAGTPVNRLMVFSFFDAPTGGNRIWTEQQYANIYNGEFTVLLGNGSAVPSYTREPLSKVFAAAGASLYLEVTVDGGDGAINPANTSADPPISPRQRMVSTGYAFRARSADSVTPGTDLRFLPSDNAASADHGLGFYNSSRTFNNVDVNGPVLFGQGGGGLGSSTSGSQSLALSWAGDGNVGIGIHPATERLHVSGNIKATGTLNLGGGVTAGGTLAITSALSSSGITSTGAITGTTLTATSLSIRATPAGSELAGITADGAINLSKGGILTGPVGNELNIDSAGRITIKDLTVSGNVILPGGSTFGAIQVLAATKRFVLGGATGWGDSLASTESLPITGANTTTGMRIVLNGTDPTTNLVGFGMSSASNLYTVAPSSTTTTWYGGTQSIMTLNNNTGLLSVRLAKVTNTRANVEAEGSTTSRLLLTAGSAPRSLALTNRSSGTADLRWINNSDSSEVGIMTFKRASTDEQLADQVADLGYVGINVSNPKAPLHVKSHTPHAKSAGWSHSFTGAARPANGVFLGNGADTQYENHNNSGADNATVLYQYISAIFDGELVSRRMWFGNALDTSSDARAKHILGLTDPAKDLATLMQFKVTDYHWIDRSLDRHRPHKRLIAQEVEQVFPQAASIAPQAQAIPNIYELATKLVHDTSKGTLTITTAKAHELKAGDLVDLISERQRMSATPVKSVVDAHTFVIDCKTAPGSLFVYGKHVKDFHTVDYDAVSMLNVSATQELKKEHDDLAAENAKLREQLAAQEASLAKREAAQRATEARFEALEARIRTGASPAKSAPAKTASITTP